MRINKELFQQHLDNGLVFKQKHPIFDLWVYNYSQVCQYDNSWDELLLKCRGLILDKDFNIIAKGFDKFFNLSEHKSEEIPYHLPFEVFNKRDGSLITLFYYNNQWILASRGSFTSDQAIKAQELIKKYNINQLDKNLTYCFEIHYKENQIVVNYGDYEGLVLLAAFNSKTNEEISYDELLKLNGFDIVERYDGIKDINKLKELEEPNKEGFVIRFSNGFRIKIKFDEYVFLHKIITGVSTITVWEYLSEGKPFDELLEKTPDEWYMWLKEISKNLQNQYDMIHNEINSKFYELINRKEYSEKIKNEKYKHLLFSRLNSYSSKYEKAIWDMIRPEYAKAFSTNK